MANKKKMAELSGKNLGDEVAKLKKERFDLEFKAATRQLNDTMAIRRTKRQIARALTLQTQQRKTAATTNK